MIKKKPFSNLAELSDYIGKNNLNDKLLNYQKDEKEWISFSSSKFSLNVKKLALGLKEIGVKEKDTIAIIAKSSPMWMMMDFAINSSQAICVPIFSNICDQNLLFELKDAKVDFAFCDSKESFKSLKRSKYKLKKIITFGLKKKEENVIEFFDLIKIGEKIYQKNPDNYNNLISKIKEDDVATIIYTSGSTGIPKGVELTHKNLISQIINTAKRFPLDSKNDRALSFLPLAHIFERMVASFYLSLGVSIYFIEDPKKVGYFARINKPTLMTVVPRLLEKVYTNIKNNINNAFIIKRIIGNLACNFALKNNPQEKQNFLKILLYKIFDRIVYKKFRLGLGGNLKMMICGGAPLSLDIEKFFRNIGINLYVGYGTTESSPVIAVNYKKFNKIGSVGKAFPDVEIKINKDKELLARGDNIMKGYHNQPQKTKEVIDKDGWLKTGDLAKIDKQGYVTIIGRKKELFKTSGGKYVSPIPIEQNLLKYCDFLNAAIIIAEARKFVSCLLFADFEILEDYKAKIGQKNIDNSSFLKSDLVKNKIEKAIKKCNKNLNYWEQIHRYYLSDQPITIEKGELTPSMKPCRHIIEKNYQDKINEFYK